MKLLPLYRVTIDKDILWDTYLKSFPPGTDPIFRERTEHDCQTCRSFVKNMGSIVAINSDNELVSLWDIEIDGFYKIVADTLSALIKSCPIENIFLHTEPKVGAEDNQEKTGITWNHFYAQLPGSL